MPFQQIPPEVVVPGFDLAMDTLPFLGETVNGDGLFVETGRNDGAVLLLLVDLKGHGAKTVQPMAALLSSLNDTDVENRQPANLLQWLHAELAPQWNATTMFAMALAFLVHSGTDTVKGARAGGQPFPLFGQGGAPWLAWAVPSGPPLGLLFPGAYYQEGEAPFPVSECLLAFTDGVTEAGARAGQTQFEQVELPALLASLPGGVTAVEIVDRLVAALRAYVGVKWPDDDTTVFCLNRPPRTAESGRIEGKHNLSNPSGIEKPALPTEDVAVAQVRR